MQLLFFFSAKFSLKLPFTHAFRFDTNCITTSRLAEEYGLELIYNKKFHQVYEEASQELDFNQLLYRMNVISEGGSLSADEWEAASKFNSFTTPVDCFQGRY